MQFSLQRLFLVVTASAVMAAVCRVTGLRIALVPAVAAFAFGSAVVYRQIGRYGKNQKSIAVRICLGTLRLIVLLLGMFGVAVFLAMLAGA